jgi:excinuclease ABC subunit A
VVACGTPEQVAANPASHTGRYLAPLLAQTPQLGRAGAMAPKVPSA